MATPTDREPAPRQMASPLPRWRPPWPAVTDWPDHVRVPDTGFIDALNARTSRSGGPLHAADLAALLRQSTSLRHRGQDGRFGTWESRSAPSAGGLHGIHILCLPLDDGHPAGIYDDVDHELRAPGPLSNARELNRRSVGEIAGAHAGTTLQFFVDFARYDACYESAETLMWRDAGVLSAVVTLVAAALELVSIPLGRHGSTIVEAAGLNNRFVAAGGVHVGKMAQRDP